MPKNITLPSVSLLRSAPDVEKINPAEMVGSKPRRGGKKGRKSHDPQAALLAARRKQFGTVSPNHEDATEQRKDRAVEGGGSSFVDAARVRRIADPLETLFRKGLLAPRLQNDTKDNPMNAVLYQAGTKYREAWMGAGLTGVAAQDLTRDIVDGGPGHEAMSDFVARCWQDLREVAAKVGPRLLPYLNGLVIDEQPVCRLAPNVADTKSRVLAEAIAMERVRESLYRVADVFRLQPDLRSRAIETWDSGATRFETRGFIGRRGKETLALQ